MALATRRPRRQGMILPRGKDRWLVRLSAGIDPTTGKRIRIAQTVPGPRSKAEQVLRELLGKRDQGVPLPRSRLTLHEWLAEFEQVWSGHLGPQTRAGAQQILRLYVPAPVRSLPLRQLTPRVFQSLYNSLQEAGRAPGTINYLHRVLRTRLNRAVALGHLAVNPLAAVRPPVKAHREYRVLNPIEARLFLEEAENAPDGALWILLLLTGLRPEEALGLKWEDLDLDVKPGPVKLRVRRAMIRLTKGRWELAPTKTKRERTVTLASVAVGALRRHRANQAQVRLLLGQEYAAHGLIFASTTGKPLHWQNVVTRGFRPLLERVAQRLQGARPAIVTRKGTKRADLGPAFEAVATVGAKALEATGLDRMRPYDLRHSAATLLLAAGEHPKVVQEILGHASITLTLDTYSHVLPGLEERAAERLEAIIGHLPKSIEGAG